MASLEGGAGRIKVPVDQVAAAAYRAVFRRPTRVFELGRLPMLVLLAIELVPGLVTDYLRPEVTAPGLPAVVDAIETLLAMLCLSAFAVRWHALVLLSDRFTLPRRRFLGAWARFIAYALPFYGAVFAIMAALSATPLGDVPGGDDAASAILAAASLALSLAFARCSLIFPAAVVGQALGLAAAWRRMRGNTWRLVATTLLVTMPVLLIAIVIVDLVLVGAHLSLPEALSHPPLGLFLLDGVLDTVLAFLFVALGASVTAEFYRRIVLVGRVA